jgi:hypothetical protein
MASRPLALKSYQPLKAGKRRSVGVKEGAAGGVQRRMLKICAVREHRNSPAGNLRKLPVGFEPPKPESA